jgi:hypothetical protein
MSANVSTTKLVFACDFSEREAWEAQSRGYLSHVLVEVGGDRLYPVIFYDAVRLQQDLEESARHGRPFVADPGMIVLQEVTRPAMEKAVQRLHAEGYFDYFVPLDRERLTTANPLQWPP